MSVVFDFFSQRAKAQNFQQKDKNHHCDNSFHNKQRNKKWCTEGFQSDKEFVKIYLQFGRHSASYRRPRPRNCGGQGFAQRAGFERQKQTGVVTTIKNLRAGFAALEIEFRTKPALKPYLFQIQGISDMTGVAEDQASAGQLTESGMKVK